MFQCTAFDIGIIRTAADPVVVANAVHIINIVGCYWGDSRCSLLLLLCHAWIIITIFTTARFTASGSHHRSSSNNTIQDDSSSSIVMINTNNMTSRSRSSSRSSSSLPDAARQKQRWTVRKGLTGASQACWPMIAIADTLSGGFWRSLDCGHVLQTPDHCRTRACMFDKSRKIKTLERALIFIFFAGLAS